MDSFINKLERALQNPLPGEAAQHKMAHAVRKSYPQPNHNARKACVLVLIYPKDNHNHIVLIQRMPSDNKNDKHSGQVSFPGGKLEADDNSLLDCALREAQEEVGIDPTEVKAIGALTKLFIPVSNFLVFPFVAYLHKTPHFIPQPTEVRGILEVPISTFQDPSTIQLTDIKLMENLTLKKVPYYNIQGNVVWGATAMIMSELLEVIQSANN